MNDLRCIVPSCRLKRHRPGFHIAVACPRDGRHESTAGPRRARVWNRYRSTSSSNRRSPRAAGRHVRAGRREPDARDGEVDRPPLRPWPVHDDDFLDLRQAGRGRQRDPDLLLPAARVGEAGEDLVGMSPASAGAPAAGFRSMTTGAAGPASGSGASARPPDRLTPSGRGGTKAMPTWPTRSPFTRKPPSSRVDRIVWSFGAQANTCGLVGQQVHRLARPEDLRQPPAESPRVQVPLHVVRPRAEEAEDQRQGVRGRLEPDRLPPGDVEPFPRPVVGEQRRRRRASSPPGTARPSPGAIV